MGEWGDHGGAGGRIDLGEAGKAVAAVDGHGTGAADALAAGAAEGEGGVDLVLDLDEGVEDHGAALVEVDLVVLELGLGWVVWVPAVDGEGLGFGGGGGAGLGFGGEGAGEGGGGGEGSAEEAGRHEREREKTERERGVSEGGGEEGMRGN